MLTIRLVPFTVDGRPMDRAVSVPMSLAELFRTVRVVGEQLVFIEPRPGYLINLAHVESIEDDAEQERVRTPGAPLVNADWVGGIEPPVCSGCGIQHMGQCKGAPS